MKLDCLCENVELIIFIYRLLHLSQKMYVTTNLLKQDKKEINNKRDEFMSIVT